VRTGTSGIGGGGRRTVDGLRTLRWSGPRLRGISSYAGAWPPPAPGIPLDGRATVMYTMSHGEQSLVRWPAVLSAEGASRDTVERCFPGSMGYRRSARSAGSGTGAREHPAADGDQGNGWRQAGWREAAG
jgi:hypothetical protein